MTKPDLYSPNIDALKALRNDSTTAWISPDGVLHVVPLFNHLSFFIEHPGLLPDTSAFLAKFVSADGSLKISGQHMAEAMDGIYAGGWGRIGTFGGDKIELDCSGEHLKELTRKTKFLARMLNRALVCRVAKPFQKPKQKHASLGRESVWSSLRPGFVGWLSPGGEIFETPPKAPFSTFTDDPDRLPETAKAFADAVEEDERRQSDQFVEDSHGADPDGRVEWHRYWAAPYNPDMDERREMTALVLSHGWGSLTVETPGVVVLQADATYLEKMADGLRDTVAPANCKVDAREFADAPFVPVRN
ncbi:hypothetical protein D3C71_481100 [compost metagenome]